MLEQYDPEIYAAINCEERRQIEKIELIASENFASEMVHIAACNVLNNKYAEGYPGKRYYGGCEHVDVVEHLARERLKKLFGAEHANVQPHSGSQANTAVYIGLLKPGDTVLGMDLAHGGHLTHGSPVNISGFLYKFVTYGVDRHTETIDYEKVRELALTHRPKILLAGYSSYSRVIDFARFREIADEAGAILMVDMAHFAGLSAAGCYPNPTPRAQVVTTTTHKTLRGPRGGAILCCQELAKKIDEAVFPGIQGGPMMHTIAAKAVSFKEAMSENYKDYCRQIIINADILATELLAKGYRIVAGGTDNHLLVLNFIDTDLSGKEAQEVLDKVGITASRSAVPFDTRKPWYTSGLRLGTPAVTTRGMKEPEMREIAAFIHQTLTHKNDQTRLNSIAGNIKDFTGQFPLLAKNS